MQPSPYTPGQISPSVPGRRDNIEDFQRRLAFAAEYKKLDGRIRVAVGPRGVGKTSLLRFFENEAKERNFATVWVTAGDGAFLNALSEGTQTLAQRWDGQALKLLESALQSLKISIAGVSVTFENASAAEKLPTSSGRALQDVFMTAGREAISAGNRGLCFFVDEIQSADNEGLKALAYAWQHLQAEANDIPMLFVAGGLSHSQDVITEAVTFGERFEFQQIENLDRVSATTALRAPAASVGVQWAESALSSALEVAQGYPYFLQLIGESIWYEANFPDRNFLIEERVVDCARPSFNSQVSNFYRSRWTKATEYEKEFLSAMAKIGTPEVKRSDIASTLRRSTTAISVARRNLLDKGLIEQSRYGYLRFTAPGFEDFVRLESELE